MRTTQLVGAVLVVVGAVMLYLLRGPLVTLILLVLEFVVILIALILILVGVAMLVGGHWVRRRFWINT